ncbi:Calcium/calmodulin-dependent protein kinase [Abeliophyllum distichum]|uniref:Calcium/calmodulin-dependent protein kinase n=1 Tax=Abeliophyllum distichum TaxID=126358 RepID=A0ABD1VCE1_9LAMI
MNKSALLVRIEQLSGREEHGNEERKKVSTTSSASDFQASKDYNLELEQVFTTGFTNIGDSEAREVMKVEDSTSDSPDSEKCMPQFNKGRHISMWHLIHQQLASDLAAEAGDEKLHGTDGKNHVNGANILLANICSASCPNSPDSDMVAEKNESEIQEFELRKLFVIKFVREAIEKILLPEVQDQTSDDQSITSENILEQEIVGKNQGRELTVSTSMACAREIYIQQDPDDGEGEGRFDSTKKSLRGKSEKRVPKHWSNLKNWILLERFIKELVKVKKFNPRMLQLLPLKPDPEAGKIPPAASDGR